MNDKRIINRCPQCNIILFHQSDICPLCQCVTQEVEESETKHIIDVFGEDAPYPDIQGRRKKMRFALKLVLVLFVAIEALLILINGVTHVNYPWSVITGIALIYAYLFLVYWVNHDSGFASKVGLQIMITVILLFGIDYFNGMNGWSLQWAIPGVILVGDVIVAVLMLTNRSRWQSFLLLLLFLAVLSIIPIVLYFTGTVENIVMPLISEAVTFMYLLIMIFFGERKAEHEFSRRFHI